MPDRSLDRLAPLASLALSSIDEVSGAEGQAVDALLEAMFLLSIADGDLGDEELVQMARGCRRLLGDSVDADIEGRFLQWSAAVADEGWEQRMRSIAASVVDTPLAEPAFRLAVAVALADGRIVPGEADGLDTMAQTLGIMPDAASRIVQDVVRHLASPPSA